MGEFPAGWFQQVPAFFVILMAPIFAWLWVRMGSKQPSSPAKFSLGLIFVGLGFVVMIGASLASGSGIKVSPMWLVATYFLHVVGEMCLSPVGLSTVTKLAPERATSLMMGVWFLAAAVGQLPRGPGREPLRDPGAADPVRVSSPPSPSWPASSSRSWCRASRS